MKVLTSNDRTRVTRQAPRVANKMTLFNKYIYIYISVRLEEHAWIFTDVQETTSAFAFEMDSVVNAANTR